MSIDGKHRSIQSPPRRQGVAGVLLRGRRIGVRSLACGSLARLRYARPTRRAVKL